MHPAILGRDSIPYHTLPYHTQGGDPETIPHLTPPHLRDAILLLLKRVVRACTRELLSVMARWKAQEDTFTMERLRAVLEERAERQRWRLSVVRVRGSPERSREVSPRCEERERRRGKGQQVEEEGRQPCRVRLRREELAKREEERLSSSSGPLREVVREAKWQDGEVRALHRWCRWPLEVGVRGGCWRGWRGRKMKKRWKVRRREHLEVGARGRGRRMVPRERQGTRRPSTTSAWWGS